MSAFGGKADIIQGKADINHDAGVSGSIVDIAAVKGRTHKVPSY